MNFSILMSHIFNRAESEPKNGANEACVEHVLLWLLKASDMQAEEIAPACENPSQVESEIIELRTLFSKHNMDSKETAKQLSILVQNYLLYDSDCRLAYVDMLLNASSVAADKKLHEITAACVLTCILENPTPMIKSLFGSENTSTSDITVPHTDEAPNDTTVLHTDAAPNDVTVLHADTTLDDATALHTDATVLDSSAAMPNKAAASKHHAPDAVTSDNTPKKDELLLGEYEIVGEPVPGGIWIITHLCSVGRYGRNFDYALIQPQVYASMTAEQKHALIRTYASWLGLDHLFIAQCYEQIEINGTPCLLSDWKDGGSLEDAIQNETLYNGKDTDVLERIFDIAIRTAVGLEYIHANGLIHYDIKPNTVVFGKNEDAKIFGFGLAGAYAPAYCSPEQKSGLTLTNRTDIWSWAATLLEMFCGKRMWRDGALVGFGCDTYFKDSRIAPPEDVKALLRHCFKEDAADRPHSFAEIKEALLKIYQSQMDRPYPRQLPKAAADGNATILQNDAVPDNDVPKSGGVSVDATTTGAPDDATVDATDDDGAVPDNDATVLDGSAAVSDGDAPHGAPSAENTLLGLYDVVGSPIKGGMGFVQRVHHNTWNVDLAMKQPHARMFETPAHKQIFINECEAWIGLGLHPHIVSCYYVRDIEGVPSVFAEWMDGGSLKDAIVDETLYDGDDAQVLEHILDIAIQFARGLHYAHENDLIHKDVKPDNLMLSSDGTAKVSDFGIARARGLVSSVQASESDGTMIAQSGGYTTAYCSPEQNSSLHLTRRTDIWSWAVSVLEMFFGEYVWKDGVVAGEKCEYYFKEARFTPPEDVKALLRQCFKKDEAERPHDFAAIEQALLKIYEANIGSPYARTSPKAASDTADSLNNKALSFNDIGKPEEAEKCWKQALELNPNHVESVYNNALHEWRSGQIDDLEAVRRLKALQEIPDAKGADYFLAMIHLERGDDDTAQELFNQHEVQTIDLDYAKGLTFAKKRAFSLRPAGVSKLRPKHSRTIAISPNGLYMLTGSSYRDIAHWVQRKDQRDNTLSLRRISDNLCSVHSFKKLKDFADNACFSPDGKYILTSSRDIGDFNKIGGFVNRYSNSIIELWETETGKQLRTIIGHESIVRAICFCPDGQSILTGGKDKTVKLWNTQTGQLKHTFTGHTEEVTCVAFSPNGQHVLSGSRDKTIKVWDTVSGSCVFTFNEHKDHISQILFSKDERVVLSTDPNTMKLWDIETGECIQTYRLSYLDFTAFGSNDAYFIVCLEGKIKKVSKNNQCLCTFRNENYIVSSILTFGGKIFAIGNGMLHSYVIPEHRFLAQWALTKIQASHEVLTNESRINKLVNTVNTALRDKRIEAAISAIREAENIPGFTGSDYYYELQAKIRRYCIVTGLRSYSPVHSIPLYCSDADFSPDNKHLLLANDKKLQVYDTYSGECVKAFCEHKKSIQTVCYSPDGRYILTTSAWKATLWDAESGECMQIFSGHKNTVYSACFSPNGRHILTRSHDYTVRLWEADSGICVRTTRVHRILAADTSPVCYSPDGKYYISGSASVGNKLWESATGECKLNFPKSFTDSSSFCFSPNGKYVFVNSGMYSTDSNKCIRRFTKIRTMFSNGKFALFDEGAALAVRSIEAGAHVYTITDSFSILKSVAGLKRVCVSSDDCFIPMHSKDTDSLCLLRLDWEYEFPGWADWAEGARPYLEIFLTLHPDYTDGDFDNLITDLQNKGYGWLRPEGVRKQLDKKAKQRR